MAYPKMQYLLEQLLSKHQCRVKETGMQLWLALPHSKARLMIAGLSSQRLGLTHCIVEIEEQLSLAWDIVFVVYDTHFEPVELCHSFDTGCRYQKATGKDANYGAVDLTQFSE